MSGMLVILLKNENRSDSLRRPEGGGLGGRKSHVTYALVASQYTLLSMSGSIGL